MKRSTVQYALVTGISIILTGMNLPAADDPPEKAPAQRKAKLESTYPEATPIQRKQTLQHQKILMIAIHSYHDAHLALPADIVDGNNKPLLSWRVALLPFFEHADLYSKFKLNEPWDSKHNLALLKEMPPELRCGLSKSGVTETYMKVFRGTGAFMEPGKKLRFPAYVEAGGQTKVASGDVVNPVMPSFTDPMSETFGVVEAGPAVPWTKPEDIDYDAKKPMPVLDGPYARERHVSFADATTAVISTRVPEHLMRLLIGRSDGKTIDKKAWEMIKVTAITSPLEREVQKEIGSRQAEYQHLLTQHADLLLEEVRLRDNLTDISAGQAAIDWGLNIEDLKSAVELRTQLNQKLKTYPAKKAAGKTATGVKTPVIQEKHIVTKWEYKVVTKHQIILPREEPDLDKLGEEGWELVTVCERRQDSAPAVSFIFKRSKR